MAAKARRIAFWSCLFFAWGAWAFVMLAIEDASMIVAVIHDDLVGFHLLPDISERSPDHGIWLHLFVVGIVSALLLAIPSTRRSLNRFSWVLRVASLGMLVPVVLGVYGMLSEMMFRGGSLAYFSRFAFYFLLGMATQIGVVVCTWLIPVTLAEVSVPAFPLYEAARDTEPKPGLIEVWKRRVKRLPVGSFLLVAGWATWGVMMLCLTKGAVEVIQLLNRDWLFVTELVSYSTAWVAPASDELLDKAADHFYLLSLIVAAFWSDPIIRRRFARFAMVPRMLSLGLVLPTAMFLLKIKTFDFSNMWVEALLHRPSIPESISALIILAGVWLAPADPPLPMGERVALPAEGTAV